MTRLWPAGQPIIVRCDAHGDPMAFEWRGTVHQVEGIGKRWRVHQDWWRREVWRAYYKLSTHTGLLCIIFQDLSTGEWFLQRLYD